jgi:glucose/mannose-6-phosphate isomerase
MNKTLFATNKTYEMIYRFPEQMEKAENIGKQYSLRNNYSGITKIVFAGMGGSAIGGDLIRVLIQEDLRIPLIVIRDYFLPEWADESTLVLCSSYSGNTEETLSIYRAAKEKHCRITGISTGGALSRSLIADGFDVMKIPKGYQPRAALGLSFIPILYFLNKIQLISGKIPSEISNSIGRIREKRELYSQPEEINPTYHLALEIDGKIPVIIGSALKTEVIARRWKGQFCENSKIVAFHNEIPEMNHNEVEGWGSITDSNKYFSLIWLADTDDYERITVRQDVTASLLQQSGIDQHFISVEGLNFVERCIHMIHFGDWVSFWLANINSIDPTPVHKIEKLKAMLDNQS